MVSEAVQSLELQSTESGWLVTLVVTIVRNSISVIQISGENSAVKFCEATPVVLAKSRVR